MKKTIFLTNFFAFFAQFLILFSSTFPFRFLQLFLLIYHKNLFVFSEISSFSFDFCSDRVSSHPPTFFQLFLQPLKRFLMSQRISFERSSEIGAYTLLTNSYCLVGKSKSRNFYSHFQAHLNVPIAETTINTISPIGNLACGNKNGLLLPDTVNDQELMHIRNLLPENIKIRKLHERLNALGNIILTNDSIALVHPEIQEENIEIIENTLGVEIVKNCIGSEHLVGTFGAMNGQGLLVHPLCSKEEIKELSQLLSIQVVAGTINKGSTVIGGGIAVNDWALFVGGKTTSTELSVAERVFMIGEKKNDEELKKTWVEGMVE